MGNVLTIGIGAAPNDGNGFPLRDSMIDIQEAVNGLAANFNAPTPPASLTPFQSWFDTSTTPPTLRYFDGTIWVPAATLDPSSHTFASLASPSGAVSGDLSGTLPSPTISPLAVTNAKMAAGAAAANVGALGGDFSGTLPSPTIAKIQGTAISGVTGTGNAVLSAAPTITGATSISSIPFNPSISPPASFSPPAGPGVLQTGGLPFYIAGAPTTAAQDTPAGTFYVSKNTNYTGTPSSGSPPAIYGANFVAAGAQGAQVGVLGYVTNNNTVGSQPGGSAGAVGIYGVGAMATTGATATWGGLAAAYGAGVANPTHPLIGLEVDVYDIGTDSNQTRVGIQLTCGKGAFSGATPTCTNLILASGTVGNFINYAGAAVNGLNLNSGTFSGFAIATPGCSVDGSGNGVFKTIEIQTFTIAQLLAIASPATGQVAYVSDTVFSAAPTLHGTIAGAGSTTAKGIASYNGANWQWC